MLDLRDYIRKGFKFMIIGAIGSVINLGVLYVLVQYFKFWYILAEVIAILVAFAVNYNGNILVKNIHINKNSSEEISPPHVMKAEEREDIAPTPKAED